MKAKLVTSSVLLISILFSSCKKPEAPPAVEIPCIPNNNNLHSFILAFYPFTNGSLNDFSGRKNHLSNVNGAVSAADRSGNPNCAFEFNNSAGQGQFLTTANTAFLNGLTEFSVSLWYQPLDTSRYIKKFEVLVGRDSLFACPDKKGQWSVGLYLCRRAFFGRENSVWDNDITNTAITGCQFEMVARTGTWHHLAATYTTTGALGREFTIYRDGKFQFSTHGKAFCSGGSDVKDIGDLFLGLDYTGRLDDVILFDKALTNAEVTMLSQMGTCCE